MSRSENKGFRRYLPLLSLAAVLLLAVAFVLLLPLIKKAFPAKGSETAVYTPTYQTVAELDSSALQTITVTHLGGESYTLVYQDEILSLWTGTGELEPISATVSDNFIKYTTTIYVEDTVAQDVSEVQDELPDMGLEPPQITATAAFTDGSEVTISLGYSMLDTTYHYYRWSGDNSVYLCNTGVYETFEYTADMLRTITQPPIDASLVERVSIRRGDGEPIVCAFATDEVGAVQGTLQSPFMYPMDPKTAATLLSAVENFRLGTRLQPVTEETSALYGLDTPQAVVTIAQREGLYAWITSDGALQSDTLASSVITLTLGDADGDFFYFCEYEGTCYRVSRFLVSTLLGADAKVYAIQNPADMGEDTLQSVTMQTGDGTLDIRASYLESVLPNNELETDENGDIVYTTEVTCNGESVTAEAFEALVGRLKQMAESGTLESVTEPDGTPRWQMTLTTVPGRTRIITAYPMDAFHDVLAVDGVALHYISNEALEIALGEFAALLKPADTP